MSYWDRVNKAIAAMDWSSFNGMPQSVWQDKLAQNLEETKDRLDKLTSLYDQVDALLSMAKRIRGKAVDDGDYWEISDDVFQEVQKAFDEIKTASANEHD